MRLSLFISRRFRNSSQRSGFMGFIAKSSTLGILLGVSVLILALSVVNGFQQQLVERLLAVTPHIEFTAAGQPIGKWPEKVAHLRGQPGVSGTAPFIATNGMVQFKATLKALELRGIDVVQEASVSSLDSYLEGQHLASLDETGIILGKDVAESVGAKIGDSVTLLIPQVNHKDGGLLPPKKAHFRVVSLINTGGPMDKSAGFINLQRAQTILGLNPDQVTGLRVSVSDVYNAQAMAMQLGHTLSDYVYVSSWFRSQGNLYQDIQMVRTIVYLVVVLIIAVASFNIVSSLVMEVKDKQADIAILKTMGAKDSTIVMTFVLQGLTQAGVGMLLGTLFGVLLALNISSLFEWWTALSGHNVLAGVYFIDFLPTKLVVEDVVSTLAITLILAVVATVYPAWQATRVDPAKALGNG